ncbi:MAG: CO dehydrogenase/acetyl-CoA synthase delta subunit, TIM barrel [Actinobacteria bacterium]|nr:CO dehydrogenase/acetyl-CoA synthase delta subunit, TIM barrel [Actinomycetota bacterium]
MALTALDIYKLLPRTNCKECGFPTCLAFAMQMAAGKAGIDKCPPASEEAKAALGAASSPPLPRIVVGTGDGAVTMGDEVVMFRHEKTFYHPTAIAISVSDALEGEALEERLRSISSLSFERMGQPLAVDMIAVRFDSGDPARFAKTAAASLARCGKPLLLSGNCAALSAALPKVAASRPLLCPPPDEVEAGARIAASEKLPMVVRARGIEGLEGAIAAARAAGATEIVGDTMPADAAHAVADSIYLRRLAIIHRAREMACPAAFDLGRGFPRPFEAASLLLSKYGSLLVLDTADPAEIFPLLTLRQNIFTDPQRPIQVEPGIYPIGKTSPSSPVLITTNFSLTYFTVRSDVEAAKTPAYLLIAECDGMSVLTAWAAGRFTSESIAGLLADSGIAGKVEHRSLILPGMVARLSGRIEELSGWRVLVGPQESSALPSYLRRLPPAAFVPVHG